MAAHSMAADRNNPDRAKCLEGFRTRFTLFLKAFLGQPLALNLTKLQRPGSLRVPAALSTEAPGEHLRLAGSRSPWLPPAFGSLSTHPLCTVREEEGAIMPATHRAAPPQTVAHLGKEPARLFSVEGFNS